MTAPEGPRGTLQPTPLRLLAGTAALSAAAAWCLLALLEADDVDALSASWLAVPLTLPFVLVLLAVGLGVSARAWRRRLDGAEGARPVDPLAAARMVAAAKSSALVGALVGGAYAGYALFLLPGGGDSELRADRLPLAAATALAALAAVGAALLLERVLRVPPGNDDDRPSGPGAVGA